MHVQFCNEAKSCAHWLVNETLWFETETRPRHLIFSPRRDRDRDLPTFPRDRDETETFGNNVSRPSRDRDVETETTSLAVGCPFQRPEKSPLIQCYVAHILQCVSVWNIHTRVHTRDLSYKRHVCQHQTKTQQPVAMYYLHTSLHQC